MPLPAAEIARTLAMGRLNGVLHLGCRPDGVPVLHAIGRDGNVLIASTNGSELAELLNRSDDQAAVLAVPDSPPFPDSPHLGTVWISGWLSRLAGTEAQAAAADFAEANPVECLLDIGHGTTIFQVEIAEVRLTDDTGSTTFILPEVFAVCDPDPFHADEYDLLADLRDHHAAEIAARAGLPATATPVRLDRYGLTMKTGREYVWVAFPDQARRPCCVARLLGISGH